MPDPVTLPTWPVRTQARHGTGGRYRSCRTAFPCPSPSRQGRCGVLPIQA